MTPASSALVPARRYDRAAAHCLAGSSCGRSQTRSQCETWNYRSQSRGGPRVAEQRVLHDPVQGPGRATGCAPVTRAGHLNGGYVPVGARAARVAGRRSRGAGGRSGCGTDGSA